jgi:two-component system CheB/CheR fusion protein
MASTDATPIGLDALLQKVLSPYFHGHDGDRRDRFTLSGPPVPLGVQAVTTFALILHELARNAAKYGAPSVDEGSVSVGWSFDGDNLVLNWKEGGGPKLSGTPKTEGFGTVLSNHSVRGQLGGAYL